MSRVGNYFHVAFFAATTLLVSASAYADTLDKIRKSGEFVLGHRESSSPFSFNSDNATGAGFSVDLCLKIFDQVKEELKLRDAKVKYV
ncbi:MAG: hypothetical protein ACRDAM_20020, partial [Casimicrobium sp.]